MIDNILIQEYREFVLMSGLTALQHCKTHKVKSQNYPFIELKSESAWQNFKLHMIKEMVDKGATGKFSAYGLGVSVPDW